MFEKFGELDSYEEINELAINLSNEGDTDSIYALAQENGIPREIAEMFVAGDAPEICDAMTAAIGKIDVECAALKPEEIMADWVEYIKACCFSDDEMAQEVRRKGKSLEGCIAELLKWSFGHQTEINEKILKAAKVTAGRVTLGIPGMARAKKIIRNYYMGGGKK